MTTLAGTTLDLMLKALAEDTWENLREAWALSVSYGEETITDSLTRIHRWIRMDGVRTAEGG